VRAPDDAHTGAAAGLDSRNTVLEDKALLRGNGLLSSGEGVVDSLQGDQVDVGERLAAARRDALVVAKDAMLGLEDGEELGKMVSLELEVGFVGRSCQRNVNTLRGAGRILIVLLGVPVAGSSQVTKKLLDSGKGLSAWEVFSLKSIELLHILIVGDGKLGPFMEEAIGGGARAALELGLDTPGQLGTLVLVEDKVDAQGVEILGVKEKTIHVKKTSAYGREAVDKHVSYNPS